METCALGTSGLSASRLAFGCWRIARTWEAGEVTAESRASGKRAVAAAHEAGFTLFDHADIYCGGVSESLFGEVLAEVPSMRDTIVIATKCGIRFAGDPDAAAPYRYDFSKDYILRSCEASLKRLGVETIDIYQLHRPDWLMDPTVVAEAFSELKQAGKVREFGVSNFLPSQLGALQAACPMKLVVNQVEISLACRAAFENGTLDQCLADKITPMAWSPLGGGKLGEGAHRVLPSQEGYRVEDVNAVLDELAAARGVNRAAVALAWLLKHPAGIIPIVGSSRPDRIRESLQALSVALSREEWYRLLVAARGLGLP